MGFVNKDKIKNPYYEALQSITRTEPPEFCKGIFNTSELDDEQIIELQDYCSLSRTLDWGTGIGILEAADHIVEEAVSNGNICGKSE